MSVIDFAAAYPNSRKVSVQGGGTHRVVVPMREISLSGGEPPLRVYDTSGPQACDVREGLPPLRAAWIAARGNAVEASHPGARSNGRTRRSILRGAGP